MTAGAASIHMEAPLDKDVALPDGDVASTTTGQTLLLSHPGSSPEQVTHPDQWVDVALDDDVIPAFRPASTQQSSPMVLQPVAMAAEDVPRGDKVMKLNCTEVLTNLYLADLHAITHERVAQASSWQ